MPRKSLSHFRFLLLPVSGLLILAFLLADSRSAFPLIQGRSMGTTWSVRTGQLPSGTSRMELQADLQSLLDHLDLDIFSTFSATSQISRFNHLPVGETFKADSELLAVIRAAQEIHGLSNGAFDMTVGPLVDLWGFGPAFSAEKIPEDELIRTALTQVDNDAVFLPPACSCLVKNRPVQVDLSAIAKGYAVDQIAGLLDEIGIKHYIAEVGGELKVRGGREGQGWDIAIEAPLSGRQEAYTALETRGESLGIAGSGDYRNFFEIDGRRFSHEIDPRTGWPVDHALASVTVISRSSVRADALATALFVLGPEQGFELASSLKLAAYFIMETDKGLESRYTQAFSRYLNPIQSK